MPAMPWRKRQRIDPAANYVVMYTRLPLSHYRSIPEFFWHTFRIQRQLAGTPGLVGYALNAEILRKRFWTMSAWEDEASLHSFTSTKPHRDIMGTLATKMGATRFAMTHARGEALPPSWTDVTEAVG